MLQISLHPTLYSTGMRDNAIGLRLHCLAGAVLLAMASGSCLAEAKGGGADAAAAQALKKAQGMLRQVTTEKTALQEENAKLTQQLQQFMAKLQALEPEVIRQKNALDTMRGSNNDLQGRVGRDSQQIQKLSSQNQALNASIKAFAADNELLKKAVEERSRYVDKCEAKNREIYQLSVELLNRYRDKNVFEELLEKEPFTGIAAVRSEGDREQYLYKLEDLQVKPLVNQQPPAVGKTPAEAGATDSTASDTNEPQKADKELAE